MRKEYHFWTYIVTNYNQTVMYTGVTNNLARRLTEHYENRGNRATFAGRYCCHHLVYWEHSTYILNAIRREKEIKDMNRDQKIALINTFNPDWNFLNAQICGSWPPTPKGIYPFENHPNENKEFQEEWWTGLTPPIEE